MNILQAIKDPNLFGAHFQDLDSWTAWLVVVAAISGLPLDERQQEIFTELTGREYTTDLDPSEVWLIIGRRGGKSKIVALIAVVLALFNDYEEYLTPGEIGHVMVIAVDRKQAKIVLRYIEAYLKGSPLLQRHIVRTTAESIELDNNIHITVNSCSIRSVRGYTVVGAICDEIAFWRSDESANPDAEILNAIRPAMSTIPNAMLICLSSPYARRGAMYEAYRRYYGQQNPSILVWQAPTWVMNPTVPKSFLAREQERDPLAFESEYGASFRSDIAAALDPAWIDAALILKDLDLPKSPHSRPYVAFVDMSGGRSDSAAIAIAHTEPDQPHVFVDAMRRFKPPFNQDSVVDQMADLLKQYGLRTVTGDNYGADFVVEIFRKAGVNYIRSQDSASDLYLQSLPLFSTGKLQVPDNPRLRVELTGLERKTRVSGKDLITHPPGQHDDLANVVCAAAVVAWRARNTGFEIVLGQPSEMVIDDYSLLHEGDRAAGYDL